MQRFQGHIHRGGIPAMVEVIEHPLPKKLLFQDEPRGGVSASRFLRVHLKRVASAKGIEIRFPLPQYSTDNAAMIATAGRARFIAERVSKDQIGCAASVVLV